MNKILAKVHEWSQEVVQRNVWMNTTQEKTQYIKCRVSHSAKSNGLPNGEFNSNKILNHKFGLAGEPGTNFSCSVSNLKTFISHYRYSIQFLSTNWDC